VLEGKLTEARSKKDTLKVRESVRDVKECGCLFKQQLFSTLRSVYCSTLE
jgi:hypothetical protein